MSNWSSGYVTEVDYTHGFYKALTPNLLSLFALLRGTQAPGGDLEPRNYCELGCGQGYTTNVLAAANPHIQFYATDFNPNHIAGAQDLARSAKLENVHFSDDSFGEYLRRKDLPDFDFIVLHGIYSWISAEARHDIVRFISKKLKPGGVVYISYNCMPGWASIMPLRHLLVEHAKTQGASRPLLPRISASLDFAESLNRLEASYFKSHPSLAPRLERMRKLSPNYLAHEYFNSDLTAFYFTDVVSELAEAKLTWVGPASGTMGMDNIHLTPEQREILAGIDDILFRETVRDHIIDQSFRRDIFVKGAVQLSRQAIKDRWLDTRFALTNGERFSQDIRGSRYTLRLDPALCKHLETALKSGPRFLHEIMNIPDIKPFGLEKIVQILVYLTEQGACSPCLPEEGLEERKLQTGLFNKAVAERARHNGILDTLASPVLGGGLHCDRLNQLVWLAYHDREKNLAHAVWNSMSKANLKMIKNGTELQTAEENLDELKIYLSAHEKKVLPIWRSLKLLDPSTSETGQKPRRLSA